MDGSAQPASLEALFERYRREGDLDALGRVYDQASPQLHALARRLSPSRGDADDLVQTTFLTAIERADAYDGSRKLLPWLLGILAHHALSARRARGRKPDPGRLPARDSEDPADATEARELDAVARTALSELPAHYREVLEPVLLDDERAIDVAQRRGSSAGVVRMQVHRGLALLRKALPASAALSALLFTNRAQALAANRRIVMESARRRARERGHEPAPAPEPRGPLLAWPWPLVASTVLIVGAVLWGGFGRQRAPAAEDALVKMQVVAATERAAVVDAPAPARAELAAEEPLDAPAETAAALARPAGASLTAELRWSDGTPAEAVEVVLQRLDSPDMQRYAMRGITNARGRVVFRNCAGRLSLRADRGAPIAVEVAPLEQRVLSLDLPGGVDVEVRVVDASGAPVSDASIGFSALHHYLFGAAIAQTDAAGRASLRDVPKGRRLVAWKRGMVCRAAESIARGDGDDAQTGPHGELELVLVAAAAELRGVVLDSAGRAVPRADVRVGPDPLPRDRARSDAVAWRTRTNARGEYEFAAVPAGTIELRVRSGSDAPSLETLELAAGEHRVHDVRLARGATIRGTLRARTPSPNAAGEAASEAWIAVGIPGTFDCVELQVAVGESFEVGGLGAGEHRLTAAGPSGFASVEAIALVPGIVYEQDLWLERKASIAGRLLERGTARPLEGWHLVAQRDDGARVGYTRTDELGAFELVSAGNERFTLRVHEPGRRDGAPTLVVEGVELGRRDLLIEIDPDELR